MKNKHLLIVSSIVLFFSLCSCYLYIAFYNRFVSDDLYFLSMSEEKGVLSAVKYFYFNWEGAYVGFFYNFGTARSMSNFDTPFLYNLLLFSYVFIVVYFIFKIAFEKILAVENKQVIFLLTCISIGVLYYNDLAIAEVWYWVTGSIYLFFPPLFFLILIVFITNERKNVRNLCYCFFFIFGSVRLNYSLLLLTMLVLYSLYMYLKYKVIDKRTLPAILLVIAGLTIYIAAPGNYIRHAAFAGKISFAIGDIISNTLKMTISFFKDYVLLKLPIHALFMLPVIFIGSVIKDSLLKVIKNKQELFKLLAAALGILIVLVIAQCFIMYMAKGAQTKRTLPMVNFSFLFFCILTSLFLGAFVIKKKLASVLLIAGVLGSSTMLCRRLIVNRPIVREFAMACDERADVIKTAVKMYDATPIDTLYLKKLPRSGWLHPGEIDTYISGNTMNNGFLEYYYKTQFAVDLDISK